MAYHPSDEDAWGHKLPKKKGKILPKPHPTEGTEAPPAEGTEAPPAKMSKERW